MTTRTASSPSHAAAAFWRALEDNGVHASRDRSWTGKVTRPAFATLLVTALTACAFSASYAVRALSERQHAGERQASFVAQEVTPRVERYFGAVARTVSEMDSLEDASPKGPELRKQLDALSPAVVELNQAVADLDDRMWTLVSEYAHLGASPGEQLALQKLLCAIRHFHWGVVRVEMNNEIIRPMSDWYVSASAEGAVLLATLNTAWSNLRPSITAEAQELRASAHKLWHESRNGEPSVVGSRE